MATNLCVCVCVQKSVYGQKMCVLEGEKFVCVCTKISLWVKNVCVLEGEKIVGYGHEFV